MSELIPQNAGRIKEQLRTVEFALKKINLADDTEQDILDALMIINKASYTAMLVVKQDIQEH